jgi:putative ABC transport system permease protein
MFRLLDTLGATLERIWQHKLLAIWVLIGLIIASTLALSLPLYVDAVYSDLLSSRLSDPPYSFRIRYLGAWEGNIAQGDVETADSAIRSGMTAAIGFPVIHDVHFTRIGVWNRALEDGTRFGSLDVGILHGVDQQIMISKGEWSESMIVPDDLIPILIPEVMFYTSGVDVGTRFTLQQGNARFEAIVMGMWRAVNPDDPAWIFPVKFFDEILLTRPTDAWRMTESAGAATPVTEAAWYLVFDPASIRTSDVGGLLNTIITQQRALETVLPGVRLETPENGLRAFNEEVDRFTLQLFIIIAPVGGLVFYFVSLVAGLLVNRQRAEDAKLSSRGMSRRGLLTLHFLMWFGLIGTAFAAAIALSPSVVRLVGQTSSFLRFENATAPLLIQYTPEALIIGALTGLIAASSGLILAWRSTRQNVNSARQLEARAQRAWWQRTYLDLLLLIPAGYALYTLNQSGGLATDYDSPFSDPLTFVGPTLFALSMTLLFLRAFPLILRFGAGMLTYTGNIPTLMAFRELTRSIGRYRGTLLMLAFTLSLTGFTASMASTLDRSLVDTVDYRIGADLVLITAIDAQSEQDQDTDTGQVTTTVTGYNPPPVEELYGLDGIESVSRFGQYTARLTTSGRNRIDGTAIGVDRWALASTTFFREDFAREHLASLMNRLATTRTGVILSRQAFEANNLALGQDLQLEIQALNTWYPLTVRVLDVIDYFPTVDPNAYDFYVIMNLDPIFEAVGTALPFNVWVGLTPGASPEAVFNAIQSTGFPVLRSLDPQSALIAAQAEPGRRGVLGFLSIGFIASITLTLIGAVIQNTASYRAQARQLGTLQAMGLSGGAVSSYLMILQTTAAGASIAAGTVIGAGTTLLFLPLLDFSGGLPPYLVRVAWDQIIWVYVAFAGAFVLVTLLTTLTLSRQQLATVVRLGEI